MKDSMKIRRYRKIINLLTHRIVLGLFFILLQIFILTTMILQFSRYFTLFYAICLIISLIAMLVIVNNKSNPSYKIAWLIPIMAVPVFGGLFYVFFGGNRISKKEKKKMYKIGGALVENLKQDEEVINKLEKENLNAYVEAKYIINAARAPIYNNSYVEYLKIGEIFFEKLVEELKKAKEYIFLEYFIIHPGLMWNTILEILEQKVKEGVDVRVIYDDVGSIVTLPEAYHEELIKKGIKCSKFNRFLPFLSIRMNNRDHRKITVIDGKVGFTGGINLADEYINERERFGHWKDNGVMIKGEAVYNLTIMFLSIWDYINDTDKENNLDYEKYKPKDIEKYEYNSYIAPYGTVPLTNQPIGENIYLNLINRATKYIYITTPYLIIDNEMITALCNSARSGIDVRIITPGVPDKKKVYEVTQSYYDVLVKNGVKIYEYEPGFIHAKTFIVDDLYATCGTINLDFRSLYLHFECGVWMYNSKCILDIKEDIEETLKLCRLITKEECEKLGKIKTFTKSILRVFAPLL